MKQQRKGINPQIKRNLANGFGSLISNQRAIDCAKEFPIWMAIIFLLLSFFIPTIPTLVTASKTYGSQFIATTNYGMDTALTDITQKLSSEGYTFVIEDKNLHVYKADVMQDTVSKDYINKQSGEYTLRFYYQNLNATEFNDFCTARTKDKFETGTINVFDDTKEGATAYTPSFIVFSPTDVFMGIYKTSTTTAVASSYRGVVWDDVSKNVDLLKECFLKGTEGKSALETREIVMKNYCTFFDKTYVTQKGKTMAIQSGIFMGIYCGLIIFMGLLVFLLTRGKRNVFRYLTFFTCEKISVYAALSPAILSMILGFLLSNFAQMLFIILFGLRVMWLTMRQLRPEQI